MSVEPASLSHAKGTRGRPRWIRAALGYGVALGCLVWVFHDIHPVDAFRAVTMMRWDLVFLAVVLDVLSYVCQGARWGLLLRTNGRVSIARATQAIYAGLFVNEVLPLRPGEAVRSYIVSRWIPGGMTRAVSSIMVERLLDAVWLVLASSIAVLFLPLPKLVIEADLIVTLVVSLTSILFAYVVFRWRVPIALPRHAAVSPGLVARLSELSRDLAVGLREIGRSGYLWGSFGLTGSILLFQIMAFWLVMWAYGLRLPFWHGAVVLLVVHVGTAIPSAPSNLGTYQFFTVVGLTLFGIDKTVASGFSIAVFAVLTVPLWAIGITAFAASGLNWKQLRGSPQRPLES